LGEGGNKGQVVLYPAQYQARGLGAGVLRAFDEFRLRIYYDDTGVSDWRAPVIRRVDTVPGVNQVQLTVEVVDPDPGAGEVTGVAEVVLAYSSDGVSWKSDVGLKKGANNIWTGIIGLPVGVLPGDLVFIVQAVDGAGNVAYSANKGELYSGAESVVYLPFVQ
jgi:hypothetical protein